MYRPRKTSAGYSLIELIVVLSAIAVLSFVAVRTLGSRPSGSIRTMLDEVEGTIAAAHSLAVATGRDVTLVTRGRWDAASPLELAYGDAATVATTGATAFLNQELATPRPFKLITVGTAIARGHSYAGIVAWGNSWWTDAIVGNGDITAVHPFNLSTTGFQGLIGDPSSSANNLFQNGTVRQVLISGVNKRFTSDFYVAIVGLSDGHPVVSGPMGLLIGRNNGATLYKFYNPGIRNGNGQWRRI